MTAKKKRPLSGQDWCEALVAHLPVKEPTSFDKLIEDADWHEEILATGDYPHLKDQADTFFHALGRTIAQRINGRETGWLQSLTSAVENHHDAEAKTKERRLSILKICVPSKEAVNKNLRLPDFEVRTIVQALYDWGFNQGENAATKESFQRMVRDDCKHLGVPIKGKRGRPKIKQK
jgi:hypothetical protein